MRGGMMKEVVRRMSHALSSFRPAEGGSVMGDALNHVDLCFVVDTTGSMQPFISAAQAALLDTVEALGAKGGVEIQVGLVEYRDHPPQDVSFVTRHYPLTSDLKKMRKVINGLGADGGGDRPEAVYDGVSEAAVLTEWRAHSCRFILLVGDAPPHGYVAPHGAEDVAAESVAAGARGRSAGRTRGRVANEAGGAKSSCRCGLDVAQVTAAAEENRVTVHALPMSDDVQTKGAFTEIARGTGGVCAEHSEAGAVVGRIGQMLDAEFSSLQFDREVLEFSRRLASFDAGEISERLSCSRLQAAAAVARLGRRGFLRSFEGGLS